MLTLAVWADGEHVPNFEFDIEGTPCKRVLTGAIQHYGDDIQQTFPTNELLRQLMHAAIWQFR